MPKMATVYQPYPLHIVGVFAKGIPWLVLVSLVVVIVDK